MTATRCAITIFPWILALSMLVQTRALASPAGQRDELSRLAGHTVEVSEAGYIIRDVAGEGTPLIGRIERRGAALYLVVERGETYRLTGPLAKPRIAGPGYKVWVLGTIVRRGGKAELAARRLGVLAPPDAGSAAVSPSVSAFRPRR